MGYGIKVVVWGPYALFSRPEMKVERVSYDVMTPSAARGLLEAVYWKPAIRWHIDKIHVLKPIRFTNVRRNEVNSKMSHSNARQALLGKEAVKPIYTSADIQQRAALILRDVRYVIEAHFTLTEKAGPTDTPEKHYNIVLRRLCEGRCFHQPCFGCREFPAHFRLLEEGEEIAAIDESRDLGYMLYDMDYSNPNEITPLFFRAELKNGVMPVANCGVVR